ncbi:hypothetical protein EVAR_76348_1 [Eumeta japonica]|uniref:Uncharacterized protein n=1 Tax=Eumeta variegata TaxID=151549 RepID=A0A4C1TAI5_EUMVA|nr:hypothetical protein EVAR_76348_1 [Eumeta japonica]
MRFRAILKTVEDVACLVAGGRIASSRYYHKTKWSTSLRSRHIVDLALSESDQSLRSPGPARIPSPAIPDRSSAQPSPSSSTSSPQFKRPKTVNRRIRRRLIPNGVSTDVEECTSGTKKLLMELGINKLGEAREILYVIEIEDTEHDIMSQVSNLVAPFPASTIQPASTHQVITFPDVHVSADEDMPSSSRTFRVSSPTEALLDPESGSSYDDSEFSDDDDAEYLVTSAKKEIQQNLSDDEELPPQDAKILSMISTFHDNSTYTGTSAGEEFYFTKFVIRGALRLKLQGGVRPKEELFFGCAFQWLMAGNSMVPHSGLRVSMCEGEFGEIPPARSGAPVGDKVRAGRYKRTIRGEIPLWSNGRGERGWKRRRGGGWAEWRTSREGAKERTDAFQVFQLVRGVIRRF